MSTLAELRTRVRYNVGEPTGSQRFYDASINNHINEGYSNYQLELIMNGEGDLLSTALISWTANVDLYPLPSNWVKTKRLERIFEWGNVPLEYSERRQIPKYKYGAYSRTNYLPTYRFINRNILFEPPPNITEANCVLHEFYALQPKLVADGDSPPAGFIEPWQNMLVLYATVAELEAKEAVGGVVGLETFRARLEKAETLFYRSMQRRTEGRDSVTPDEF